MEDQEDLKEGLYEAVDNAVEYFTDLGLDTKTILEVLSQYRHAYKETLLEDDISGAVDDFLNDVFGDGRGTE